ncbi:MAG TPA: SPOR domain-containing protein [Novosphingobium sp.]|nr:SPOR domain-containing protein [Novosphingobium sp.]
MKSTNASRGLRALSRGVALLLAGASAAALAQQDDIEESVSRPVVQTIPAADSLSLNAALARLGRNPRDVEALIDAGKAASNMGDVDAAVGFFQRADQLSPGNARVKAGLAGALVRSENPFDAIPLFVEAERAGAIDATFAGDRGLAYDLVGDSATAQGYYRQALTKGASDEVIRRYALSLAIAGDKRTMETTLSPLLLRQDKAAWRTRAFGLAILGSADEAESIAYATMPRDLAAGISPYLRYMPRLTPAQQAAAANFGHFPRPADIGRDDPRVAQYATTRPRAVLATADTPLVPSGKPLGRNSRSRRDSRGQQAVTPTPAPIAVAIAPPPVPQPTREITTTPPRLAIATPTPVRVRIAPTPAPPQQLPAAAPAKPVQTANAERVIAVAPQRSPSPPPTVAKTAVQAAIPGFTVLDKPAPQGSVAGFNLAQSPAAASATAPTPPPAAPPKRPSLADAFGDLTPPSRDIAPAAGAVDLRRIRPTRPTPDPKTVKPAPPPSHPSRIWVQVATGRDRSALAFDWRRIAREAPEATRGKQAFTSNWGQTNRLLTGPFESQAAANAFLAQLRRADVSGAFLWTSPAGQVVDTLGGK